MLRTSARLAVALLLVCTAEPARAVRQTPPEPSMFGTVPAFGLYVRHARGLSLRDIVITTLAPDARPPMLLQDVQQVMLDHVEAPRGAGPFAVIRDVSEVSVRNVTGVPDGRHERIASGTLPQDPQ